MLDILVQPRRNANAAKRFFKRWLKGLQYVPPVIVARKLRSYGVARRQLLPGIEHRQSRYLNPTKPKVSSLLTHSSIAISVHDDT